MNFSLVGIGAGLVSALLIAVVAKATPLALLLFLLAPIPVLIVTLGWDHRAGLVACAAGGIVTALALSPLEGVGFAIGTGLPAWWLGYLALLGRPDPSGTVEWYPLGRLLTWIAVTAALTVLATAFVASPDYAAFHQRMRRMAELFLDTQLRLPRGTGTEAEHAAQRETLVEQFAFLAPLFAAQGFTLILTLYIFVAARIVAISGRLPRPWPYIPATTMPRSALVTLLVAVLLANLGGFVGVFGRTVIGAMLMAFGLQGLAALHHITVGRPGRGAILAIAYVLLALSQGLLILAVILFGIADTALGLRRRMAVPKRSPSDPPPT